MKEILLPFLIARAAQPTDVEGLLQIFGKILGYVSAAFWIAAIGAGFYAAFLFLTAAGDAEKVKKARTMLWYTVIAIAVGLMANTLPALVDNILSVEAPYQDPHLD